MSLDERLELDITEALRGIDSIEDALGSAASSFKVALADALDVLGNVTVGDVDASSVTTAIDSAVAAADAEPVIDADAEAVTSEIDAAVAAADGEITIEPDVENITSEIDAAVEGADTTIEVDADVSAAEDAIEGLGDTAASASSGVGQLEGATSGVQAAAGAAVGDVGALAAGAGSLGTEGTVAAGVMLGLGGAVAEFFTAAVDSESAQRRLTTAAGDFADEVEHIDLGGLNEDLGTLAERTGQDDEKLRLAAARFFDLGKNAGVAGPEIAESSKQLTGISIALATANPALGQAGDVADRLTTGFARGGRALAPFGIALSSAEINARALADTGKETAAELTIFEKAQAGLNITMERTPDLLSKINEGIKNPQIQVQILQEKFANALEVIGQPLIVPVLDLLEAGVPVATALAEVIARLAESVLPTVVQQLELLGDGLSVIADVVDGISQVKGGLDDVASEVGTEGFNLGDFLGRPDEVAANLGGKLKDLVFGSDELSEAEKRVVAETESLTGALSEAGAAVDQTGTDFIEAAATARDLDDEFAKLGITYADVATAAAGGEGAQSAFIAQLKAAKTEGRITGDEFDRLKGFVTDLGGEFNTSAQAALNHAVASGEVTKAQADAAIAANTAKDGTINYAGALNALRPAQEGSTGATRDGTSALDDQTVAVDALGRSLAELLAAEEAQIQKELSLASAALGAEGAARNVEKAEKDLAKAIAEGGAESDKAIEADFRLRQARQQQVEAVARLAAQQRDTTVAQLENSGVTVDQATKSAIYRENLLALAGTIEEPMRSQVVGLANDITAIPDVSNTDINADAAAAWDTINETEIKLDVLTQERIVQIAVEVFGAENAQRIIDGIAHDAGNITVGVTPKGAMAGGSFEAGEFGFVGEVEPEIIVARRPSVVGNQAQLQAAISSEVVAALDRFGDRAGGGSTVGPINVYEVAQDPEATANAVAFRLGEEVL